MNHFEVIVSPYWVSNGPALCRSRVDTGLQRNQNELVAGSE